MPLYSYKALSQTGERSDGVVEAATLNQAQEVLEEKGLRVFSLEESEQESPFELRIPFLERVKVRDLVVFSRQLAMMISTDIPIVQALKILQQQTDNSKLRDTVAEVAEEVEGGTKLSDALERHVQVFGDFYVSMVKSGETSGKLDAVLLYLAEQQEKDYDMMSKIRGALTYPAFIIFGMVGMGYVMVTFVLPKLTAILKESNVVLPFSTRVLIAVSGFAEKFWLPILIMMIALVIGIPLIIKKTHQGRVAFDLLMLRLPLFGNLIVRKMYLVRIMRSLSTLLQGGVPLPDSLKITAEVVAHSVYKDILLETVREVEDGNPVASVFMRSKDIPKMVSRLIVIGEETGNIEGILGKLSEFYQREVENAIANLTTLLEPFILIVMGAAVGVMVLSIMLPMFKLAEAF
ncbi:MAG: hypothetical protein A3H59_02210 [Candidatus Jacksonbacteria bacterium RIFCSPLOWO2_02_FULL_43_9]|nr:MAG: hypothetical protein UV70_C0001G0072 [Parcubacteria group bacterium GW2011_GWA2_43_13]OGY69277.1 MAG: hypothetical protein A3B94_02070 [Candidatus Jacksonbacteria bacterium RIFCSPHIGHO2_02_FULL_43_10]OGY71633.1 MAG: hypothetical protein A2986_01800 [Candidatus Jacksonbacteria bacterium RIFCSPLOWO2_01_FULL_44_13]OGY74422.1 MAG: hypothetical protein A3H59_02210 [Candidatus Jacksonbacteria bacterium RIFCSPLOWO2_02_FULL_43_9]